MLIILEGPDCAGKTTFAERLLTQLAIRYPSDSSELRHSGPPRGHPLDEYVVPLLPYRPHDTVHIVADRWHVGETIYPEVLGRSTKMTPGVLAYINLFLEARGATVTRIMPPLAEVIRRFKDRGDDLLMEPQIHDAYRLFERSTIGMPIAAPSVNQTIAAAQRFERLAEGHRGFVTYIGPTFPHTLIVGDVRGCDGRNCKHNTRHYENGTAFMPYPNTSGAYLFDALTSTPSINPAYARFGCMNACDVDDIHAAFWSLGCPGVVALGARAHDRLTTLNIPHSTVPHPQYIRRFHYTAGTEYGQLIYEVSSEERNELKWRPSSRVSTDRPLTAASSTTS